MINSIEKQILTKIKKAKRGTLFFVQSFVNFSNPKAVSKALERLVAKKEIERVSTGLYVRPEIDKVIGKIIPSIEDIAKAIAKRDRARIVPTGVFALNILGLSTQVPLNVIYLTDGAARKVKIDNRTITFKKATPKNVAAVGEISRLAIQALRTIGKENVTEDEIKKIQQWLSKEKKNRLQHDLQFAPVWIRDIMQQVLKSIDL